MAPRLDEHHGLFVKERVEDLPFLTDVSRAPDEVWVPDQCLERMRAAVGAVSHRTRDVSFMHRLGGVAYADIARRTGMSASAITKYIARALLVLRDANTGE
jgi:DNA-directed RNA polymerase specialized sigma24 family protein